VWLVPWAAELGCRCTPSPWPQGPLLLVQSQSLATFVSAYFAMRELCVLLRGEPPSALDASVAPRFGDCMPSNALLGGQFRLDKADLETTGRTVFVPARPRKGLYVASGLAMCSHLLGGVALCRRGLAPPWWLLGSGCALLARKAGDCGSQRPAAAKAEGQVGLREAARLACRAGELWWMWCCVRQLQRCEAGDVGWLATCSG